MDGFDFPRCDSCHLPLDRAIDFGRLRHVECPVPPLPAAALDVIERVHRRAEINRGGQPAGTQEGTTP